MIHYQRQKIRAGRMLSILVPIIAAIVLSFGNDYLSWQFMEENDLVNVGSVKYSMILSNVFLIIGLFFTILISNIIFRQIIRQELANPLQKLIEGMTQVQNGNMDYQIEYQEEEALYEAYESFNEMVIEMRRLSVKSSEIDRGRRELLLNISHDLRSPLTSIVAYVQGLIDHIPQTEEARERYLLTIKQKALDINKMVERIFLFSKLDYGEHQGNPERIHVNDELRGLTRAFDEQYAPSFQLKLLTEGDGVIHVDPGIFTSVCSNIIENSHKYNDKEKGKMTIRVKEETEFVKIVFADNGPGVEEEALPYMWEVFYRTDKARNHPCQGSGIGLAIVKKAVDNWNGKVTSKNRKNGGLVTTIRIPKAL